MGRGISREQREVLCCLFGHGEQPTSALAECYYTERDESAPTKHAWDLMEAVWQREMLFKARRGLQSLERRGLVASERRDVNKKQDREDAFKVRLRPAVRDRRGAKWWWLTGKGEVVGKELHTKAEEERCRWREAHPKTAAKLDVLGRSL